VIRVFIGHDHNEETAYHTMASSITRRASRPVSITAVSLGHLRHVLDRERDPRQSNDFAFSRWLIPYLCDYKGWALFMDCDMILRDDIAKLWALRDERYAVQVVKHDYVPRDEVKYLGTRQYKYRKKNWSSVMLFNCARCTTLTPDYVNTAPGLELHQFEWLGSDDLIGALPKEWNHLVGEYAPNPAAKLVHYTVGGPYFHEYADCEYADEWRDEHEYMNYCEQMK
jgi:hypothetical protein